MDLNLYGIGTKTETGILSKGSVNDQDSGSFFSNPNPNMPNQHRITKRVGYRSVNDLAITTPLNLSSQNNIITQGDEEFKEKYSKWITDMFHFQAVKTQRRLSEHYKNKLDLILKDKQYEFLIAQRGYKDQLARLEEQTVKFYKLIEILSKENEKVREIKDSQIEELKKSIQMIEKKNQIELEEKMNLMQAKCEEEKLKLLKGHSSQMNILNEKLLDLESNKFNHFKIADQNELKAKNECLTIQLKAIKEKEKRSSSSIEEPRKNEYLKVIKYLKLKLQQSERENFMLLMKLEKCTSSENSNS